MGGALHAPGNLGDGGVFHTKNTTAEWNIFVDPLAASIVFKSGIPIRLIALDATNKVPIGPEFLREFESEGRPASRPRSSGGLESRSRNHRRRHLLRVGPVGRRRVAQTRDRQDRARFTSKCGKIRPKKDEPPKRPGKPNANVAIDADAPAFRALFLDAFTRTH